MKPRFLTVILMFISAYSPLFLILAVKDYDFEYYCFNHPTPMYILLGGTLTSIIFLFIAIKTIHRGSMSAEIVSVKNRSVDLINYTIPYIVSFFGIDLSKISDVVSVSIFLIIMLLLTVTTKSVFLNPILALAGYGLYDLEYKYNGRSCSTIVISKYEMHNGERFYIRSLTRYLYFVTEQKIEQNE